VTVLWHSQPLGRRGVSQWKWSNSPSMRSLVMDEERLRRAAVGRSALCFPCCQLGETGTASGL